MARRRSKRRLPPRDPKTGRFRKRKGTSKKTSKRRKRRRGWRDYYLPNAEDVLYGDIPKEVIYG